MKCIEKIIVGIFWQGLEGALMEHTARDHDGVCVIMDANGIDNSLLNRVPNAA